MRLPTLELGRQPAQSPGVEAGSSESDRPKGNGMIRRVFDSATSAAAAVWRAAEWR